jgi:hypothetical protein
LIGLIDEALLLLHNFQLALTCEMTISCSLSVGVTACVGEVDGFGDGVREGIGVGEGVGFGDVVGLGAAIATPLFHLSFFPTFTQVNFLFALMALAPSFVQLAPALTAAALLAIGVRAKTNAKLNRTSRFMLRP